MSYPLKDACCTTSLTPSSPKPPPSYSAVNYPMSTLYHQPVSASACPPPPAIQHHHQHIVIQPPPVLIVFRKHPMYVTCPNCCQSVLTTVNYEGGALMWLLVFLLMFFFFPLMCVPCCTDSCKDVHHYCPQCYILIGIKKRI